MQNKTHAVMAQRKEPRTSRDDFPTPPWATRALLQHVLFGREELRSKTCLEPACGAGHMARVLSNYFKSVRASDAYDYGYGKLRDFLSAPSETNSVDWVITNPPFRLSEQFVVHALKLAREGVAILARSVFIESVGRYNNLFRDRRPSKMAQFTERVPMVKGRLDIKATTATSYAWLVWEKDRPCLHTELVWIPPCRKALERPDDYASADSRSRIAR